MRAVAAIAVSTASGRSTLAKWPASRRRTSLKSGISAANAAASASPAKTSWAPRTERTGHETPVQVRSS